MAGALARAPRWAFAGLAVVAFIACGHEDGTTTRVVGNGAASGGSAGQASCLVDGVEYESGETYGPCDSCECKDGHGMCGLVPCEADGGAAGAGAGGGGAGP